MYKHIHPSKTLSYPPPCQYLPCHALSLKTSTLSQQSFNEMVATNLKQNMQGASIYFVEKQNQTQGNVKRNTSGRKLQKVATCLVKGE